MPRGIEPVEVKRVCEEEIPQALEPESGTRARGRLQIRARGSPPIRVSPR